MLLVAKQVIMQPEDFCQVIALQKRRGLSHTEFISATANLI